MTDTGVEYDLPKIHYFCETVSQQNPLIFNEVKNIMENCAHITALMKQNVTYHKDTQGFSGLLDEVGKEWVAWYVEWGTSMVNFINMVTTTINSVEDHAKSVAATDLANSEDVTKTGTWYNMTHSAPHTVTEITKTPATTTSNDLSANQIRTGQNSNRTENG